MHPPRYGLHPPALSLHPPQALYPSRPPLVQGVTFTAVSPLIAIGLASGGGVDGLVLGTAGAWILGDATFAGVAEAAPIGLTTPFFFGWPAFSVTAIISMVIVMAITVVETTGDVFATGEIVGQRITPAHIANALRADGLSTTLGVLNSFPYTCFAQNVGLVRLSRVKSRWVVTVAGAIMIVLGLLPKAGAVVAAIPQPVIGGGSLAMFASVAVVGIQTLSKVDLHDNRNAAIVSTSIGLGLLVTLKPDLAQMVPSWLQILFGSGVTLGATVAIVLNIVFFHIGRPKGEDVALVDGKAIGLDDVNEMERDTFVETFGGLYAGATWPVERVWEQRPFESTADLRRALQEAVLTAGEDEQLDLVRNYVDIVELLTTGGDALQAQLDTGSLALEDLDDAEAAELAAIHAAYREKVDFPLIMCVSNLADRAQLIAQPWRRVESSPAREARAAVSEVLDIADERLDVLLADANPIRGAWSRKFEQLD